MTMKLCTLLSFLSLLLFSYSRFGIVVDASKEEQPDPFKTFNFKTEYGEIIDCIDILKQSAFIHPLLKNHKIQKSPSHFPDGSGVEQIKEVENLGFGKQQCPDGTIPVRRNTNEENNSDSPTIQHLSSNEPLPGENPNFIYFAVLQINETRFLGAQAWIDTANPKCRYQGESSAAFIWLSDGVDQKITVGWTVDPQLYGDYSTHLSTYWSGGADKGCYDLRCPGFVQVDNSVTLGSVLPQVSTPGGPHYGIQVNVQQDTTTKHWWLVYANKHIGYWPSELFPQLTDGASRLDLGGRVAQIQGLPTPSMGSGQGGDDVSSFTQIQYLDSNHVLKSPNVDNTLKFVNCPKLFGLDFELSSDPNKGANFRYGGHSGDCFAI